nr:MAG TPA: hypothetical protein [Caudoviricetes sp.]
MPAATALLWGILRVAGMTGSSCYVINHAFFEGF